MDAYEFLMNTGEEVNELIWYERYEATWRCSWRVEVNLGLGICYVFE